MSLDEFAATLRSALAAAGVPYMVVGSFASSYHGEPRTTRDLDLVIDPAPDSLRGLVQHLEAAGFYASPEAADDALARRTQLNVVDPVSGWKADLIIRKETPFARAEFGRRLRAELPGGLEYVASAEDTVIAKLLWAREGESERQLRDVAAILAVSSGQLDRAYLERWVTSLDLGELWEQVQEPA